MSDFTDPDVGNGVKGAVHGAALVIFLAMGLYNGFAWLKRRQQDGQRTKHLAVNATVYTAGVVFEGYQIARHCK